MRETMQHQGAHAEIHASQQAVGHQCGQRFASICPILVLRVWPEIAVPQAQLIAGDDGGENNRRFFD